MRIILGVFGIVICFCFATFSYAQQTASSGQLGQKCTIDEQIEGGAPVKENGPLQIINAVAPGRSYSNSSPRPFNTLVFHDPGSPNCNPQNMINYGNKADPNRGGIAYGYHFYIAQDGKIHQAADLDKRTNHVGANTRGTASGYTNASAVGVTLMCGHSKIPQAQLDSARKLGHALQLKYSIPSNRIFGHGELQTNRSANEGLVAARSTRNSQASSNTQLKYNLPNGAPVVCTIEGQAPAPCTGSACEYVPSGGQVPNQTQSLGQNTGYQLPPSNGSAGSPSTDSRAWNYPPASQQPFPVQQPGPADQPKPVNRDGTIKGGSFTPKPSKKDELKKVMKEASPTETEPEKNSCVDISDPKVQVVQVAITRFNLKYGALGTWPELAKVPTTKVTPRNATAVAYAKAIKKRHDALEGCGGK